MRHRDALCVLRLTGRSSHFVELQENYQLFVGKKNVSGMYVNPYIKIFVSYDTETNFLSQISHNFFSVIHIIKDSVTSDRNCSRNLLSVT